MDEHATLFTLPGNSQLVDSPLAKRPAYAFFSMDSSRVGKRVIDEKGERNFRPDGDHLQRMLSGSIPELALNMCLIVDRREICT
jgi:hypothetical protein